MSKIYLFPSKPAPPFILVTVIDGISGISLTFGHSKRNENCKG